MPSPLSGRGEYVVLARSGSRGGMKRTTTPCGAWHQAVYLLSIPSEKRQSPEGVESKATTTGRSRYPLETWPCYHIETVRSLTLVYAKLFAIRRTGRGAYGMALKLGFPYPNCDLVE